MKMKGIRRHVKLETENSCPVARGKLAAGNPRSGIALIITLTIMALLLILAVAFMTNMRSERQVSLYYRRQVEARQAALAGLHTAIAKMSRFYTDAEAVNGAVATMAGRFYYTNGTGFVSVSVPGGNSRSSEYSKAYPTNNMLMFSWTLGRGPYGDGSTNWGEKVNINGGNFKWPREANQSGIYLPVSNPCVNPTRAGANGWGPNIPAIWTAYMRINDNRDARFAFWIDDESSKINISNAYARDLTGSGGTTFSNIMSFTSAGVGSSAATLLPYAKIVQRDVTKGITKEVSSVELKMLDVGVVSPTYNNYEPDGPNKWSAPDTLSSIENARNTSTWRPFQSSDEVLSLENRLTMNDYQAVKSCLTAWSVENEDTTQLFRDTANRIVARTNIGVTITTTTDAEKLYDFIITTNKLANSTSLAKFFNNATFQSKYPGPAGNTNASVYQIAANIVSYISDPTKVAPIGSRLETVGSSPLKMQTSYDPKGNLSVPSGACGLWKAAYMNEVAMALCWQKKIVPPSVTQYQLWAALCVELINPYEVPLPRASKSEQYQLFLDGNVTITCNLPVGSTPSSIGPTSWTTNSPSGDGIEIPASVAVDAHSYSEAKDLTSGKTWFQWPVGAPVTTNSPPKITSVVVSLPKIRQTMNCSGNKGIIDWYPGTNNWTFTLQPGAIATDPLIAADFWSASNPARVSMAKNDPRVHVWYGPYIGGNVTIRIDGGSTGLNTPAVNFTGGDNESYHASYALNAARPEYRSNFVIAEGGMNSLGELGFIHTGKPWRSLSLQYYGAQADEAGEMGSSVSAIPDWALLDLFSVNTPPIYGRVNINNGGWHLGNNRENAYAPSVGNCPTFEEPPNYPRHPNLVATWTGVENFLTVPNYQWAYVSLRTSAYNRYAQNNAHAQIKTQPTSLAPTYDSASVPLAAALNVFPETTDGARCRNRLANYIYYRYHPLTKDRTSFAPLGDPSDDTFLAGSIYQPYYTVGQICEVPGMNSLFTGNGAQAAYTDADKEDTVRRIINVLTTRGDAFTINAVGYSDGGEARLQAVVERVRNHAAIQVVDRNQFRIRQVRWLNE